MGESILELSNLFVPAALVPNFKVFIYYYPRYKMGEFQSQYFIIRIQIQSTQARKVKLRAG